MVVCVCIVRIECPVLDVRGVGHAVGVPFLVSPFFVCDMCVCVYSVCIECPVLDVRGVGRAAAGRRRRVRARSLCVMRARVCVVYVSNVKGSNASMDAVAPRGAIYGRRRRARDATRRLERARVRAVIENVERAFEDVDS